VLNALLKNNDRMLLIEIVLVGDNDSYGSEDSLNGKHFPMELHLVFYKQEYGSQESALKHSDGLAVLAFFFKISQKPNAAYVQITQLLTQIIEPNTNASFDVPLALEDYIHINTDEYYVYNGSLTTPPCLEVI
jgi:carbonic anhydrase